MDNHPTESLNNSKPDEFEGEDLDNLLSLRGKPFADWKEERKYLQNKWGKQGQQISVDIST